MNQTLNWSKNFEHLTREEKIYEEWEKSGVFIGTIDPSKPAFCVAMPPPNITGILHLGHVLDNTPQDVMARWHRMRGFATLWIPGTDHASIATQHVVKRELAKQGIKIKDLSREEFIKRVWEWKEQSGSTIIKQLKRLGCSCDWTRERFTMDQTLSRAVLEAFIRYYKKGLIYQGQRLINWCAVCGTALAEDEVKHQSQTSNMYYIKYALVDDPSRKITVATVRPETIFGDLAIAVNPNDERYRSFIGKKVSIPIINREIPIIFDEYVDRQFGSGALKITPSHDFNDFEIGARHNLGERTIINQEGKLSGDVPDRLKGLPIKQAREETVKLLEENNALEKVDSHKSAIGCCYRCNQPIEPLPSKQWFVKMTPLAEKAKQAVEEKKVKIIPESERADYFTWMNNIKDWCISRQLWWGHRIPIYYCSQCQHPNAALEPPSACEKCGAVKLSQDEDVLDTWFSSQLWPYSTLGWPEKTADFEFWFPNNWLISGRDILFFWDARIIMSSLELTGEVPFKTLVLHGMVRDEHGEKLSKSLGNSPDPLTLFDQYGADAIRAALMQQYPLGRQDCRLGEQQFKRGQALVTKLWNSARFIAMQLANNNDRLAILSKPTVLEDRWIVSRLKTTIQNHDRFLEINNFAHAFGELTRFFWGDFCDWYIEIIKPRLDQAENNQTKRIGLETSLTILINILKLFHPYIPFVTEEIFDKIKSFGALEELTTVKFLATASWPNHDSFLYCDQSVETVEIIQTIVKNIREIRHYANIPAKNNLSISIDAKEKKNSLFSEDTLRIIRNLASIDEVTFGEPRNSNEHWIPIRAQDEILVFVKLPNLVSAETFALKLGKARDENQKQLQSLKLKIADENFINNAPAELIDETKEKIDLALKTDQKLAEFLKAL
ncbi:MAG TPA: valine--tRNA ligase [Oligoflexia bacterium]|nr:valine--tRNA ligase [Oligoflexia bacterium]HMP26951.1 valine--tRNA ligase [Oligoflexia bacterium]